MNNNDKVTIQDDEQKKKIKNKPVIIVAVVAIIGIVALAIFFIPKKKPVEVITVSTISEIINIEELSTFTTTYKGIATVYTDPKIEKFKRVKYHVAYDATVDVGIDLSKVEISINNETKDVLIIVPEVNINEITVVMDSMDFMFIKDKYDTAQETAVAYSACNEDVYNEASAQKAILDLARQNAVNVLKALTQPIVQQINPAYNIVVK